MSVVDHQINTTAVMTTFDYNWRPADRLNFFIGAGAGLVVAPRFGVELFNWLRLTSEYRITRREFSYYALTVGYVFGGRPK